MSRVSIEVHQRELWRSELEELNVSETFPQQLPRKHLWRTNITVLSDWFISFWLRLCPTRKKCHARFPCACWSLIENCLSGFSRLVLRLCGIWPSISWNRSATLELNLRLPPNPNEMTFFKLFEIYLTNAFSTQSPIVYRDALFQFPPAAGANTIRYVDCFLSLYLWFFLQLCAPTSPQFVAHFQRLDWKSFSFALSFAAPLQSIFPFVFSTQVALFIFSRLTLRSASACFYSQVSLSSLRQKLKSSRPAVAGFSQESKWIYVEE